MSDRKYRQRGYQDDDRNRQPKPHTPRPAPDYSALLAATAKRAATAAAGRVAQPVDPSIAKKPLTDLQIRIARAASEMRQKGLPPGQP